MGKTKYYIGEKKNPTFSIEVSSRENYNIWQRRRLQRYINYQINQLRGEIPLDNVIEFRDEGMLTSKVPEIYQLIRLSEDGIYERHQFKDARQDLTPRGYNRWFNNAMSNTFFHTIRTSDIFSTSDYDIHFYSGRLNLLFDTHSPEEINNKSFSGYSIFQVIKSLDYIDPFLLFNLVFTEVTIEKINGINYVVGIFTNEKREKRKFAANFSEKDLYIVTKNGSIKKFMNMYEFLFKYYRKPIFEVINSINHVVDRWLCPNEGLASYRFDKEISANVSEITSSKVYSKVRKEYVKPFRY